MLKFVLNKALCVGLCNVLTIQVAIPHSLSKPTMKRVFCLAASCLLAASAFAQTLVTTPVMGFLTLNLQQGTNFMGFALLPSMELQGVVNISASGRTHILVQGSQIALTNDQFNVGSQASHAIEIISDGAGLGFTTSIVDTLATGNEIVLADAIPAGVADGAVIKIWKLWTLGDVFGATNTAGLTGATTPATADLIQVPNGSGFDEYFYSTSGAQGTGWRQVGQGTADKASVPLKSLNGGFAIYARSAKAVVVVGQVKPGKTRVTLQSGNNFVANLCPVNAAGDSPSTEGRTLGNSGLQTGLATGVSSKQADLVLLWNGLGYDQYYYSTGGLAGTGWRKIGSGSTSQDSKALPDGAYIIYRRGAAASIQINQGAF